MLFELSENNEGEPGIKIFPRRIGSRRKGTNELTPSPWDCHAVFSAKFTRAFTRCVNYIRSSLNDVV